VDHRDPGGPCHSHFSSTENLPYSNGQFILGVSFLSMTEDGGHTFSIRDATLDQEVAVQIQVSPQCSRRRCCLSAQPRR